MKVGGVEGVEKGLESFRRWMKGVSSRPILIIHRGARLGQISCFGLFVIIFKMNRKRERHNYV